MAYEKAQEIRNNIAHGMATGFFWALGGLGYFLCPQTGTTKKIKRGNQPYFEKVAYFYDVEDIEQCAQRFTDMLAETMHLIQSLNKKYRF